MRGYGDGHSPPAEGADGHPACMRARAHSCAQASLDPMIDAASAARQSEAGWLHDFVLHLADRAVDVQEDWNDYFARHAAQATACKRAIINSQEDELAWRRYLRENGADWSYDWIGRRNYREAYEEARNELEGVIDCLASPYHALSEKFRCSCGVSVFKCECMVRCDCADGWIPKWSWRHDETWLVCSKCTPPRVELDWLRLTRYVCVDKAGARTVLTLTSGGDKHARKTTPYSCLCADVCPQTGVCLGCV